MRKILFALCLLIVHTVLPLRAEDNPAFTLGVSLSLSGEFEASGKIALAGVQLRVDDYNNSREPDQPAIRLVVRDDKSNADAAKENIEYFADEKIQAVIGPLASSLVMGMREVAEREKIVIVSPSVTSPKVGRNRDWVCRLLFDDEFQGTALARFLFEQKNFRRAAALVNDRLAYPSSVFNAFKEKFEKLGGTVVASEHYEWVADEESSYDFSEALKKIENAVPDIVLLPVNSVEVAAIISQATILDIDLDFCGGDTWMHELVLVASGHGVKDAYYITGINFEHTSREMTRFIYLYNHSNDPNLQKAGIMGYDAVSLLIEALKNGTDAESIRDGLYAIRKLNLAVGTVTVDPVRGTEKTAYIKQIQQKGNRFFPYMIGEVEP